MSPIRVGAGVLLWCIRDFAVVGRCTLSPVAPPKHLVARGLYRYVRNPMYVGVICAAVWLAHPPLVCGRFLCSRSLFCCSL